MKRAENKLPGLNLIPKFSVFAIYRISHDIEAKK